jgi:hypothetical protein
MAVGVSLRYFSLTFIFRSLASGNGGLGVSELLGCAARVSRKTTSLRIISKTCVKLKANRLAEFQRQWESGGIIAGRNVWRFITAETKRQGKATECTTGLGLTTIFAVAAAAAISGTIGTPMTSGASKGATRPLPKLNMPIVGVARRRVAGESRWRSDACGARASPKEAQAKIARVDRTTFDVIVGPKRFRQPRLRAGVSRARATALTTALTCSTTKNQIETC